MKASNAAPLDLKRWLRILLTAGAALYALAAVGTVFYYIACPSAAFFHSDCADTILWAKASVDGGQLFNPNFCYAAMLPFGGTMLMIPLVNLFGLGMTAQKIGMLLFAFLFFCAVWLLCVSLKFSRALSLFAVGSMALTLCASAKLREIFYEHVIYYSIAVAVICVLLSLYLRCTDPNRNQATRSSFLLWVLACLLLILTALDGMQVLAMTAVPVLFAAGLEILGEKEKLFSRPNHSRWFFCGIAVLSVLTGLVLLSLMSREVDSGYANAYSSYADPNDWLNNLFKFPAQWLQLFGSTVQYGMPMFSADSLINLVRLAMAMLIAGVPLVALFFFKRFDRGAKLLLLAHLGLLGVILFGYVCGLLSAANWRLSPLICTGLLICFACVKQLLRHLPARRFAVIGLCLCLLMSAIACRDIYAMDRNGLDCNPRMEKVRAIEDLDLTVGYATFWNAQVANVLSDGRLQVAGVTIDEGVKPYLYQTYRNSFDESAATERCFLLLDSEEVAQAQPYGALDEAVASFDYGSFQIFIFNGLPFIYN